MATLASGQDIYLIGRVGPSFPNADIEDQFFGDLATLDMDTGWVIGGGAGIDFGAARAGLGVDYRSADIAGADVRPGATASLSSGSIGVLTVLSEFDVDAPVVKDWLEFNLGFGIGAAQLRSDAADEWDFAYSVGGGFYLLRFEPFGIDLRYRFVSTTPGFRLTEPPNAQTLQWSAHEVTFGVRYVFGARGEQE